MSLTPAGGSGIADQGVGIGFEPLHKRMLATIGEVAIQGQGRGEIRDGRKYSSVSANS
jgi:hypothetical protein